MTIPGSVLLDVYARPDSEVVTNSFCAATRDVIEYGSSFVADVDFPVSGHNTDVRDITTVDIGSLGVMSRFIESYLPMDNVTVAELFFVMCRDSSVLIERPVRRIGNTNVRASASANRSILIDGFRSVVGDDSALMWVVVVEQRFNGYNSSKAAVLAPWHSEILAIAAEVSYDDAAPYMEVGIWDVGIIADAVAHSIDRDLVISMMGGYRV